MTIVHYCAHCGKVSRLRSVTMHTGRGGILGYTLKFVCKSCGHIDQRPTTNAETERMTNLGVASVTGKGGAR